MARNPVTVRRVATGLLLVAAGVVVAMGAETIDLSPPTVTVLASGSDPHRYPAVTDGMTIADGMLRFSAEVSDGSSIVTPPVLTLDGTVLLAEVGHPEPVDGDGEADWSRWWVRYSGVVADGRHLLALAASDALGNAKTTTFELNVVTPPLISEFQPVSYGGILRPLVSAKVKDPNSSIDPGSITLTLDGTLVPHGYDSTTGLVTYVPPADLANESYHSAVLGVADAGGLAASQAWAFYVTTYPDMSDSGIDDCSSCHPPADAPPAGWNPSVPMLPWEGVHVAGVRFSGELHTLGQSDCWVCHGESSGAKITTTGYVICGQCHGRPGDLLGYGYGWYHGQHPDIEYSPAASDPGFPVRISRNREMVDCIVCHQPGVTTLRTTGVATAGHDIPELHKASVSAASVPSCDGCHARSLTREHARGGRQDQGGQPITCSTCHRSLDANVLGAIAAGNTSCLECHARPAYVAAHHGADQGDCKVCHPCFFTQQP